MRSGRWAFQATTRSNRAKGKSWIKEPFMTETYTLQDWIISIAMHDRAFREELLRNPNFFRTQSCFVLPELSSCFCR